MIEKSCRWCSNREKDGTCSKIIIDSNICSVIEHCIESGMQEAIEENFNRDNSALKELKEFVKNINSKFKNDLVELIDAVEDEIEDNENELINHALDTVMDWTSTEKDNSSFDTEFSDEFGCSEYR